MSDHASRDLPASLTDAKAAAEEEKGENKDVEFRFRKAVSTFHYAVWASLFCKASGAPLAWADGKEFGELKRRDGAARFSAENYAINYQEELLALGNELSITGLEVKLPQLTAQIPEGGTAMQDGGADNVWVFVLKGETEAFVWVVKKVKDAAISPTLNLKDTYGVPWARGDIKWENPWTSGPVVTPGVSWTLNADLTKVDVATWLDRVKFTRACAGAGDGTGPHEKEDILLWITKK